MQFSLKTGYDCRDRRPSGRYFVDREKNFFYINIIIKPLDPLKILNNNLLLQTIFILRY